LRQYGYKKSQETGMTKYSAPSHKHDDMVIALALCVWGITAPRKEEDPEPSRPILFNEYQ